MASENKGGELNFSKSDELLFWLPSLPLAQREYVAVATAARAALRVTPLMADAQRGVGFENSTLAVFFATAVARIAARFPIRAEELPFALDAATPLPFTAAAAHTAYAANAATNAANQATNGTNAAQSAATAYDGDLVHLFAANAAHVANSATIHANVSDSAAFWAAVSRDANFIAAGGTAQALASEPLWAGVDEPDWSKKHWRRLRDALPRENGWQVWIDWYERRLKGASDLEEIEFVFATVPKEEREAGPAAANEWIKERLEELARRKPFVPPKLPATIEPIVANGKILLPPTAAEAELDSETLGAALIALRAQIAELVADLDAEANIDKRVIAFLRRLTEKIPRTAPTQAQLFMLAHEQETLEAYGKTVVAEWPTLLAGRYLATTRAFDRTVRQFPKWRLFKQNADKNRLTDQQRAEAPKHAAHFTAALREEEATHYVAGEIPDTFEEMCRSLNAARDDAREDRIGAGADTLAEDAIVSIENVLKLVAETALAGVKRAANAGTKTGAAYVDSLEEAMVDQAKKEAKKDGAALVKWSKRILVGAAVGAGAKAVGISTVIAKLMVAYPQIGKWLGPIIDLISN